MLNNPSTYEVIKPSDFGVTRSIPIGHRLTGWNAVKSMFCVILFLFFEKKRLFLNSDYFFYHRTRVILKSLYIKLCGVPLRSLRTAGFGSFGCWHKGFDEPNQTVGRLECQWHRRRRLTPASVRERTYHLASFETCAVAETCCSRCNRASYTCSYKAAQRPWWSCSAPSWQTSWILTGASHFSECSFFHCLVDDVRDQSIVYYIFLIYMFT